MCSGWHCCLGPAPTLRRAHLGQGAGPGQQGQPEHKGRQEPGRASSRSGHGESPSAASNISRRCLYTDFCLHEVYVPAGLSRLARRLQPFPNSSVRSALGPTAHRAACWSAWRCSTSHVGSCAVGALVSCSGQAPSLSASVSSLVVDGAWDDVPWCLPMTRAGADVPTTRVRRTETSSTQHPLRYACSQAHHAGYVLVETAWADGEGGFYRGLPMREVSGHLG